MKSHNLRQEDTASIIGIAKRAAPKTNERCEVPERKLEFQLKASGAGFAKFARNFNYCEGYPVQISSPMAGTWFRNVPLLPGHHACHVITDWQWMHDLRAENPYADYFWILDPAIHVVK
jgi:hypothetical protein